MENNDKELLEDEISEYYNRKESEELSGYYDDMTPEYTPLPNDKPNEPIIISVNHSDAPIEEPTAEQSKDEETEETDDESDHKANDKSFFNISAAVSVAVLLSVFFAGILSYKDEEDINYKFSHVQTSSKKYSNAQERINLVNGEITELEDEIAEKQTELNTITEYESNTGEIKSKQNVLNAELKDWQNAVSAKEKTLAELDKNIKKKLPSMITLSPGLYTVGENIFSGNYNAVGDGSIVVSSANGGAKINTSLTSEASSFSLDDGDIIKLETKAVFNKIQ